MPRSYKVVTDVTCTLGESPVWDEHRQALFWCDIPNGHIWRYTPANDGVDRLELDYPVGSIGLCQSGRLVVACGLKVLLLDPDTKRSVELHDIGDQGFPCRFNDGRIGPDGAFWVGTVHQTNLADMQPVAALWRVTASKAEKVIEGLKCANGLAFSENGTIMQHSDSVAPWIHRHHLDPLTGKLGAARIISSPNPEVERPDGAVFDVDGLYWSAGVSAGVLNAFDSAGELVQHISLPVPHPTMPCFGGEDFRTLYLTSHRLGLNDDDLQAAPLSGRLLSMRMPRPGFASPRFDDRGLV